jgi:hypothetical protein
MLMLVGNTSQSHTADGVGWQFVAIGLGLLFLYVFFRALYTRWPESYYEFDTPTDPIVSRSALRYLAFRLLPVYATCLFVGVSLQRTGYVAWWPVLAIGLIHAATTTGAGFVGVATGAIPSRARVGRIVYHGVVIALIAGTAVLSIFGRSTLAPLVPKPEALAATIWTGIFAAIGGAYLVKLVQPNGGDDVTPLIRRSNRELDHDLVAFAKEQCAHHSIDWTVFFALMTLENLQRPAWVRRAERIKGLLLPRGTYGLMQVDAPSPITDRRSIELAAMRLDGAVVPMRGPSYAGGEPYPDPDAFRAIARTYNPDDRYVAFAEKLFYAVQYDPSLLL